MTRNAYRLVPGPSDTWPSALSRRNNIGDPSMKDHQAGCVTLATRLDAALSFTVRLDMAPGSAVIGS